MTPLPERPSPEIDNRRTERDKASSFVDNADVSGQSPPDSVLPEQPGHLGQMAQLGAPDVACQDKEKRKDDNFATENEELVSAAGSHKYSTRRNTSSMLAARSNTKWTLQLTLSQGLKPFMYSSTHRGVGGRTDGPVAWAALSFRSGGSKVKEDKNFVCHSWCWDIYHTMSNTRLP